MKLLKLICLALVLALGMGVCGKLCYEYVRAQGLADLRVESKTRLALFTTAFFSPAIERLSALPALAARHPSLEAALLAPSAEASERASRHLAELNASSGSAAIYLLNARGVVVASSNWNQANSLIGRDFSKSPLFSEARFGRPARLFAIAPGSLSPALHLSAPLIANRALLGALAVQADLSGLDQHWKAGSDEVMLLDENGVVTLSTLKDWKGRPIQPLSSKDLERVAQTTAYQALLKPPVPAVVESALSERETLWAARPPGSKPPEFPMSLLSASPKRHLAVAGDLPGSQWQVALFTPLDDIESAAQRISFVLIGALCFLALSGLYLKEIFWAARQKEANRLALVHAHEELEKKHKQLANLSRKLLNTSITDPLTGAHNRAHFLQTTEKVISYVRRYNSELCVLLIDIDHFKRVNDTYGHPAGDEVLKQTTQVLRKMMRKSDTFARFGGEEFVIALSDTSPEEAVILSNRIREELQNHPMPLDDGVTQINVTMSGGLSKVLPGETSIDAAIKRSDEALYDAKKGGRNRICSRFEPLDPFAPPPPPLER